MSLPIIRNYHTNDTPYIRLERSITKDDLKIIHVRPPENFDDNKNHLLTFGVQVSLNDIVAKAVLSSINVSKLLSEYGWDYCGLSRLFEIDGTNFIQRITFIYSASKEICLDELSGDDAQARYEAIVAKASEENQREAEDHLLALISQIEKSLRTLVEQVNAIFVDEIKETLSGMNPNYEWLERNVTSDEYQQIENYSEKIEDLDIQIADLQDELSSLSKLRDRYISGLHEKLLSQKFMGSGCKELISTFHTIQSEL